MATDLPADSYVVMALATCYLRNDGEVHEVALIEPVPSAHLETVLNGVTTSYKVLWATQLGAALQGDLPDAVANHSPKAQLCADFPQRVQAAARTYQSRPSAERLIPQGAVHTDMNYSTERKRVLNSQRKISKRDNVKQHKYTHEVL
ncbi:MAG: hypothetical protein LPK03_16010 [Pontibacter sp.]|nr:hypothetical protein [Pontibacter sp.]